MSLIFNNIIQLLKIPKDKDSLTYLESTIKPIFQEYFTHIFESESAREEFASRFKEQYTKFYRNEIVKLMKTISPDSEFIDMISSRSFYNMISNVKKLILFAEFHDPPLKFGVENFKTRNFECKFLKNSECICVEGFIKENKSCVILVGPPMLKNGFAYKGFKPIVIAYDIDQTVKNERNLKDNQSNNEEFVNFLTPNKSEKNFSTNIPNFQMIKQKTYEANLTSLLESVKCNNPKEMEIPRTSSAENQLQSPNSKMNGKDFMQKSRLSNTSSSINCNSPDMLHTSSVEGGIESDKNKKFFMSNMNFRSASYHNLFSMSDKKKDIKEIQSETKGEAESLPQNEEKKKKCGLMNENEDGNKEKVITTNTNTTMLNKISKSQTHFKNGRENKIGGMKTLEKEEGGDGDGGHSSRSNFESLENDNFNDLELDLIPIGTDHNYPMKDNQCRVIPASLSNSFKKQDTPNRGTGMSINLESAGKLSGQLADAENANDNRKFARKLTSTTTFSEKKPKDNMYFFQSTERGLHMNILNRTIEHMNTKGNPTFFLSGFTKHTMRSLSKTPKTQKPKAIGYSPRSNVIYHFHDKMIGHGNTQGVLIKVQSRKNGNMTGGRESAVLQKAAQTEKKNSNYSSVSVSKEKRNTFLNISETYQANKTVEDKNKINNPSAHCNKNINTSLKYNEYVKSQLRPKIGQRNTIKMKTGISNNLMIHHHDNPIIMKNINHLNLNQLVNATANANANANDQAEGKIKNINTSYTKNSDEKKKTSVLKEKISTHDITDQNHSESKKANKSTDKKIFENRTNAQTKISIDELLSFKKGGNKPSTPCNKDGGKYAAAHNVNSGASMNNNILNKKANFLNIKYV